MQKKYMFILTYENWEISCNNLQLKDYNNLRKLFTYAGKKIVIFDKMSIES